jgi:hypothetical protein
MSPRGLLRVDEVSIDDHLKDAALGRDDPEVGYLVFELGKQLVRQTDGSRCVPSLGAVLDGYLHRAKFTALVAVLLSVPHSCIWS